ncbi:MAG: hypothetical protein NTZ78_09475 [Candidatus Aureabacteria bacterium]|nr:hypothetical protein [Candidatus Auribacterota bacterium]
MLYEVSLSRVNEMAPLLRSRSLKPTTPWGNFMFQNEPNHLAFKKRFFNSLVKACSIEALRLAYHKILSQ